MELPQTGPEEVQSPGQFEDVSPASHTPFPHVLQSEGQVTAVSELEQTPSPQKPLPPQSWGQEFVSSPESQMPFPQTVKQSSGQVAAVSPASQIESPQVEPPPVQSSGQFAEFSPRLVSQIPLLLHPVCGQSSGQVWKLSDA